MLDNAIVVENSIVIDPKRVKSQITASVPDVKDVFSLAPTKVLVVFKSKLGVDLAVAEESGLWNMFDDVRTWSEGEMLDDRIVCLECFGIHPKCCSEDNLRRIGEN